MKSNAPEPAEGPWFVYILQCEGGSFYVGHSSNVAARVAAHCSKKGSRHTMAYRPGKLVYFERFSAEDQAVKREVQLKKWTREKKMALIVGDYERLKALARGPDRG